MKPYERVKLLRKTHLNLTQGEFAKKIRISRSNLGNIETGAIGLTERVISDICSEFNVSENWLRNGDGDMFNQSDGSFISSQELKLPILSQPAEDIIKAFFNLPSEEQMEVNKYIMSLLDIAYHSLPFTTFQDSVMNLAEIPDNDVKEEKEND